MRNFFALLLILVSGFYGYSYELKVIDGEERTPLAGATVFSHGGLIIGISNENGVVRNISGHDYPLMVRCLGFETAECKQGVESINLLPAAYELGEVVISPVERPIVRIVCYVREYISGATGADTVVNFNEHIADFFCATGVKGFKSKLSPRFLKSRLYARKVDGMGKDSIYCPEFRKDEIAWEKLLSYPEKEVKLEEIFKVDESVVTEPGKSGMKKSHRLLSSTYSVNNDYLASYSNHKLSPWFFKMLGLTMDFDELQSSWVYRTNRDKSLKPWDVLSGTFSLSVLGKGKWIKKAFKTEEPVRLYGYYELYPMEVEFLTKDEAKSIIENTPQTEFKVSAAAPPLSAAIQRIVDEVNLKK